jgi:hypothetical protein
VRGRAAWVGTGVLLLGALAVLATRSGAEETAPAPALRLRIVPGGTAADAAGMRVAVTLVLRNEGTAPATVNGRLLVGPGGSASEVELRVLGPDSRPRRFRPFVLPAPERWVTLAPGEAVHRTLDVADLYDVSEPGPYAIQAVYENRRDRAPAPAPPWQGRVASRLLRLVLKGAR